MINSTVDLIADTILMNIDEAAECSHVPKNVKYWIDANARCFLAIKIAEALALNSIKEDKDLIMTREECDI